MDKSLFICPLLLISTLLLCSDSTCGGTKRVLAHPLLPDCSDCWSGCWFDLLKHRSHPSASAWLQCLRGWLGADAEFSHRWSAAISVRTRREGLGKSQVFFNIFLEKNKSSSQHYSQYFLLCIVIIFNLNNWQAVCNSVQERKPIKNL